MHGSVNNIKYLWHVLKFSVVTLCVHIHVILIYLYYIACMLLQLPFFIQCSFEIIHVDTFIFNFNFCVVFHCMNNIGDLFNFRSSKLCCSKYSYSFILVKMCKSLCRLELKNANTWLYGLHIFIFNRHCQIICQSKDSCVPYPNPFEVWEFLLLHISTFNIVDTCACACVSTSFMGMIWYLFVVFICIFLVANEVKHLLMYRGYSDFLFCHLRVILLFL